jgi:hypothetical protein
MRGGDEMWFWFSFLVTTVGAFTLGYMVGRDMQEVRNIRKETEKVRRELENMRKAQSTD